MPTLVVRRFISRSYAANEIVYSVNHQNLPSLVDMDVDNPARCQRTARDFDVVGANAWITDAPMLTLGGYGPPITVVPSAFTAA